MSVPVFIFGAGYGEDQIDVRVESGDFLQVLAEEYLGWGGRAVNEGRGRWLVGLGDGADDTHKGRQADAARYEYDGAFHVEGVVEVAAETDFHFVADLGLFVKPVGDGVVAVVELDGEADGGLDGGGRGYGVAADGLRALDGYEEVHPLTGLEAEFASVEVQVEGLDGGGLAGDAGDGGEDSHDWFSVSCGV